MSTGEYQTTEIDPHEVYSLIESLSGMLEFAPERPDWQQRRIIEPASSLVRSLDRRIDAGEIYPHECDHTECFDRDEVNEFIQQDRFEMLQPIEELLASDGSDTEKVAGFVELMKVWTA